MQAAYCENAGVAAQVLRLGKLPDPQPSPGEVRVRLRDGLGEINAVGAGLASHRVGQPGNDVVAIP